MVFFLLLWLLNSVTQEQLEGVSNYFTPTTASKSVSGSDGALGGTALSEEGALTAKSSKATAKLDLPPPKVQAKETKAEPGESDPKKEALKKQEDKQFEEAKEKLEKAIKDNPAFKRLAKNLMIDNTPEGLRIQVVDQDGLAMFPSGSSKMFLHTKKILELITKVIFNAASGPRYRGPYGCQKIRWIRSVHKLGFIRRSCKFCAAATGWPKYSGKTYWPSRRQSR